MRKLLPALLIAAACMHAAAIVAPNANTGTLGNNQQFALFGEGASTTVFQWQLSASDLTAMAGGSVTGIGFRLASSALSVSPGTDIGSWDLELSSATNSIGALSTTFASNIGADGTTVYNSNVVLGGLTGGAGPNPFFTIGFASNYAYTGGDLVLTLVVSGSSSISVDANDVNSHGDTVALFGGSSGPGQAEFYNYPITELLYTPGTAGTVPEPSSVILLTSGLGLIGMGFFRRRSN